MNVITILHSRPSNDHHCLVNMKFKVTGSTLAELPHHSHSIVHPLTRIFTLISIITFNTRVLHMKISV